MKRAQTFSHFSRHVKPWAQPMDITELSRRAEMTLNDPKVKRERESPPRPALVSQQPNNVTPDQNTSSFDYDSQFRFTEHDDPDTTCTNDDKFDVDLTQDTPEARLARRVIKRQMDFERQLTRKHSEHHATRRTERGKGTRSDQAPGKFVRSKSFMSGVSSGIRSFLRVPRRSTRPHGVPLRLNRLHGAEDSSLSILSTAIRNEFTKMSSQNRIPPPRVRQVHLEVNNLSECTTLAPAGDEHYAHADSERDKPACTAGTEGSEVEEVGVAQRQTKPREVAYPAKISGKTGAEAQDWPKKASKRTAYETPGAKRSTSVTGSLKTMRDDEVPVRPTIADLIRHYDTTSYSTREEERRLESEATNYRESNASRADTQFSISPLLALFESGISEEMPRLKGNGSLQWRSNGRTELCCAPVPYEGIELHNVTQGESRGAARRGRKWPNVASVQSHDTSENASHAKPDVTVDSFPESSCAVKDCGKRNAGQLPGDCDAIVLEVGLGPEAVRIISPTDSLISSDRTTPPKVAQENGTGTPAYCSELQGSMTRVKEDSMEINEGVHCNRGCPRRRTAYVRFDEQIGCMKSEHKDMRDLRGSHDPSTCPPPHDGTLRRKCSSEMVEAFSGDGKAGGYSVRRVSFYDDVVGAGSAMEHSTLAGTSVDASYGAGGSSRMMSFAVGAQESPGEANDTRRCALGAVDDARRRERARGELRKKGVRRLGRSQTFTAMMRPLAVRRELARVRSLEQVGEPGCEREGGMRGRWGTGGTLDGRRGRLAVLRNMLSADDY